MADKKDYSGIYLDLLKEMEALHLSKKADYGDNLYASEQIGILPWKGCWLRVKDKMARVDNYCRKGSLKNEGVEDSLLDIASYCLLAVALRREKGHGESFLSRLYEVEARRKGYDGSTCLHCGERRVVTSGNEWACDGCNARGTILPMPSTDEMEGE